MIIYYKLEMVTKYSDQNQYNLCIKHNNPVQGT